MAIYKDTELSSEEEMMINWFISWQQNPFKFIKAMWNLEPTRKWDKFVKWLHLTWQQSQIVEAVRRGVNDEWKRFISIKSWHWIWKSSIVAMLILWYLFCFKDAQVPCTAPTQSQMYDVLWKEIAVWLNRMPEWVQWLYEISGDYVRMAERPRTWFARARTARKDSPEAIAGIHSDHVAIFVDEASWVPDEVFTVAQWALTNENVIFLMISNPTRLSGYFYKSHTVLKDEFQCFTFSSLESPIVASSSQLINGIVKQYWEDSDEYRVRVLGEFPDEDVIREDWYMKLFRQTDIRITNQNNFGRDLVLWVDPAWDWKDQTAWVLRDNSIAKILRLENTSTPKGIAQVTATLMTEYNIPPERVVIDNFWVWADSIQELALMWYRVYWLFLGKQASDPKQFLNKRAELYWRLREWLRKWWELYRHEWWEELLTIYYRRKETSSQIQIMDKMTMRKEWIRSQNVWDALMMTFSVYGDEWRTYIPNFWLDPRAAPVVENLYDL